MHITARITFVHRFTFVFVYHIKCAFVILGFCYPFNGLCRNEVYCICKYKTKFLRIYDKNWQRWIFICIVTSLKYSFSYYDLLGSWCTQRQSRDSGVCIYQVRHLWHRLLCFTSWAWGKISLACHVLQDFLRWLYNLRWLAKECLAFFNGFVWADYKTITLFKEWPPPNFLMERGRWGISGFGSRKVLNFCPEYGTRKTTA